MYAEDEADLLVTAADGAVLERLVRRRVAGEPLEYVLGWAEFLGRRIVLEPGVFVPRRRTEFLATIARALVSDGDLVLDLGCGSGAIAAVLDGVDRHAVDIDPAAVQCARRNVTAGTVYLGDLYAPLPSALRGRVDLIVANAPYVPTAELELMPREARLYEHAVALDGGPDGLAVQRRVVEGAPDWLRPGGHVLIETSVAQAVETVRACEAAGLTTRVERSDELDATVVTAGR